MTRRAVSCRVYTEHGMFEPRWVENRFYGLGVLDAEILEICKFNFTPPYFSAGFWGIGFRMPLSYRKINLQRPSFIATRGGSRDPKCRILGAKIDVSHDTEISKFWPEWSFLST